MSRQLAISACASIMAMAAFVLVATPAHDGALSGGTNGTGATIETAAPAIGWPDRVDLVPAAFDLIG